MQISLAPNHALKPTTVMAEAIQKTLSPPTPQSDDAETEARHALHDQRERGRARSRDQQRVLQPWSDWTDTEKVDLDHVISRTHFPTSINRKKPRSAVRAGTVVTACRAIDRSDNPFLRVDGLGRPRQDTVFSTGLSATQAANAYNCILRANAMGLTLSTHVVITWAMVGIYSDQRVHEGVRKVFATLRDLNRRQVNQGLQPLAWVWTLERSQAKGLHCHIMIACGPKRRGVLLRAVARAVASFSGRALVDVTATQLPFQSQDHPAPAKPSYVVAMTFAPMKVDGTASASREIRAQWVVWRYIFKGVEPSYWDGVNSMFRVLARCPQGRIQGKRWGYSSATLGDAAWGAYARTNDRDPTCIARFVGSLTTIAYPDAIDSFSPIWSA